MFKTIWFVRRKAGTTREHFEHHYETRHRFLGEKVAGGYATRYVRHYLSAVDKDGPEPHYDCIMEMWFPDRGTYDRMRAAIMGNPETMQMLAEDEERFIDRPAAVHYAYEDSESDMPH
jgi:uncharacterized protein (TIGR02118 family)